MASGTSAAAFPFPVSVTSAAGSAEGFECEVRRTLDRLDVDCEAIAGRRRYELADGRAIAGFAVALAGLSPRDSLCVQRLGIGAERRLGWGVFVPAKAITYGEL